MREFIEFEGGVRMAILYEDRSVLAIDKAAGWMLAPAHWRQTGRNLQLALETALAERPFWVRKRSLKFLRFVHRLDAETTGVLLLVKNRGAVEAYSQLFESRSVEKRYLAVGSGAPERSEWVSQSRLATHPSQPSRMRIDPAGKEAETRFTVLKSRRTAGGTPWTLIEARPLTGRTHQIRVHLTEAGCPVVGDKLYGGPPHPHLGLRACSLSFTDPFHGKAVVISAREEAFVRQFGFKNS